MREKQTLFQFLYGVLTQEIYAGKIEYGERLPSAKRLSTMYNVGIRTVKDVLDALRTQGLIQTEERKSALVIYRKDPAEEGSLSLQTLFERRDAVLEIQMIIRWLMPGVLSVAISLCGEADILAAKRQIRGIDTAPAREKLRKITALNRQLISKYGNPLLLDLFIDINRYVHMTIPTGEQKDYHEELDQYAQRIKRFVDMIEQKDQTGAFDMLTDFCRATALSIVRYYEAQAAAHPELQSMPQVGFSWYTEQSNTPLHLEICHKIMGAIRDGVYAEGDSLPPIAVLASDYHVSIQTMHRALNNLTKRGFIQTTNGVGSVITLWRSEDVDFHLEDTAARREILAALCALQIMAIGARPVAWLAFERITGETIEALESKLDSPFGFMTLSFLWRQIIGAQPYATLRAIFDPVHDIVKWGHPFTYIRKYRSNRIAVGEYCREAFDALRTKNREKFSKTVGDAYRYVFILVKEELVTGGVTEARSLVIPTLEFSDFPR